MLKLLTGCSDASLMKATMVLESMPPDRNAPSGTSAIIWLTVARRSASRKRLCGLVRPANAGRRAAAASQ